MSILKVNPESYSEVHSEDSIKNNWAAVYAKSEIDNHRDTAVLDHPDGSVTKAKLADEVNAIISKAEKDADTAVNTANTAVNTANAATATANTATATAYTAVATADTAAAKSEDAQQRAISADTKSDAAVSSASVAVQKAESVQSDLSEHISDTNIHTSAEEKETLNNGITSAHQYADRAYSLAQDARLLAGSVDANLTEHISDTNIHTTAEEKQNLDARLTSVESGKADTSYVEDAISEVHNNISEAIDGLGGFWGLDLPLIKTITLEESVTSIDILSEAEGIKLQEFTVLLFIKYLGDAIESNLQNCIVCLRTNGGGSGSNYFGYKWGYYFLKDNNSFAFWHTKIYNKQFALTDLYSGRGTKMNDVPYMGSQGLADATTAQYSSYTSYSGDAVDNLNVFISKSDVSKGAIFPQGSMIFLLGR